MSREEKSPSPIRGRWYSSPRRERCERAWKSFIPLGGHACVVPHTYKYTHTRKTRKRGKERERVRARDRIASLVVMQGTRRGMRAVCPPSSRESHPTVTPGFHLILSLFSEPSRWQAGGGRTSFPRLTAGRRGEGNENNEIQRSSVIPYAGRVS